MAIILNGKETKIRDIEIDADGISHITLENRRKLVITALHTIEITADTQELVFNARRMLSLARLLTSHRGRDEAMR